MMRKVLIVLLVTVLAGITLVGCDSVKNNGESSEILTNTSTEETKGEAQTMENIDTQMNPIAITVMRIGDKLFTIELADNSSADAFFEKIKKDNLTLDMHDYGNFEKVANLAWKLPTNDENMNAEPGDITLYQGNKLSVYYGENSWSLTRIGKVMNATAQELKEALGDGNVSVEFFVEWTE